MKITKPFKRSDKQNQRRQKAPPAFIPWRFGVICICILLAVIALIARSAYIQVLEPGKLIQEGDLRSLRVKALPSARGIISDRNGEQLAVSVPVQAVWLIRSRSSKMAAWPRLSVGTPWQMCWGLIAKA